MVIVDPCHAGVYKTINMQDILLSGFDDSASEDTYDEDFPTKQTELLALSLRRMFYSLQNDGLIVGQQVEAGDVTTFNTVVQNIGSTLDGSVDFLTSVKAAVEAGEEVGGLPALPGLEDVFEDLTPLLPALLAGVVSPAAIIPVLAPYVIRFVLAKMLPGVVGGGDSNLASALSEISQEIHTSTETTIEQYNSLCEAIYTLEELKQVVIMRTAEIDKVITSEPL